MVINQNFNDFSNDCTIASCYEIMAQNYGIKPKYTTLQKLIDLALMAKVLFKKGAIFETIYEWFVKYISRNVGVELIVLKTSILGVVFSSQVNDRTFWGIWLRNGNKVYLTAIKKGYLTKDDIDRIAEQGGGFHHNNVWGMGNFHEVYGGLTVRCSYDVLIYGIEKGVYGSLARTFIPNPSDDFSCLVSDYVKQIHFDPDSELVASTITDMSALNKASEINMKYKIGFTK